MMSMSMKGPDPPINATQVSLNLQNSQSSHFKKTNPNIMVDPLAQLDHLTQNASNHMMASATMSDMRFYAQQNEQVLSVTESSQDPDLNANSANYWSS